MVLSNNEIHPAKTKNGNTVALEEDSRENGTGNLEPPAKPERRQSDEPGLDHLSVPLASTGAQGCLPMFLRYKFADKTLEKLYMAYFSHHRRQMLQTLIWLSFIFDVSVLIHYGLSYSEAKFVYICLIGVFVAVNIVLAVLIRVQLFSERQFRKLPFLLWVSLATQIYIDQGSQGNPFSASFSVGWLMLFIYSSYILLPVGLTWCMVLSILSGAMHTVIAIALSVTARDHIFRITNQIAANFFLYLCVNILGIIAYFFTDRKQRRAFLETKSSLSTKVIIEQEYKQQERLLLSVLPKHVADEMVKDMGSEISGQFRKIYMSRHENVSILFADMVGFTAISSTCTAAQLVQILNELFANFDKLATLYCQLRIKILGDCYYCICGAPEPRPDHAVLSIHMGLAVVEAISEVREKTRTNVNMRVGIHTGAVLGGVLGQKQWQFDVLGKEVTLANKMESGGVPGRVHISEATKGFLKEEFELEAGKGEEREDYLRMEGVTTYLIKAVNKPFPEGTLEKSKAVVDNIPEITPTDKTTKHLDLEETDNTDINKTQTDREMDLIFQKRLYESLTEPENLGEMSKNMNWLTLRFVDGRMESGYTQKKEHFSGVGMVGLCLVTLACFFSQLCIGPKVLTNFLTFAIGEIILVVMALVTIAINFPQTFPRAVVQFSNWMESRWLVRSLWGTLAILIMASLDVIDMVNCDTEGYYNSSTVGHLEPDDVACQYPDYFIYFAELCLIGVTLLFHMSHVLKSSLLCVITCVYAVFPLVLVPIIVDRFEDVIAYYSAERRVERKYTLTGEMIVITLILQEFNRTIERISRRLYFAKEEAEDQKEEMTALRQKNEALVYNILPPQVAKDFLGRTRKDEELYSHSYDNVGVMFASCPNFNAFYSEDAINNNGLECLRFLNEIISDYDELLSEPRFRSITKIKTVQATYMAASGMMTVDKPGASIRERWQHLDDLVQLAFSLKVVLDKINAQSFNSFVLRIGINHGPIVAGVIGARKPHYDIWGNTVNVSSRMESTGQAGKMQVVEESMLILREFGYTFEKRGLVTVKGKGELLTFFVNNRDSTDMAGMPNHIT